MLSIVVLYHNEPKEFILECVNQLKSTIDVNEYEIIIVDDKSDIPLEPIEGTKIIHHKENKGVGQAFDTGVANAKGEDVILMACDIRFIANGWASKLQKVISENPKSLICTSCVCLNDQAMDFEKRRTEKVAYGATILMFHDHKTNPSKNKSFRGIIEAKWWTKKEPDIYEIPCILGACYGVKKSWYNYIDGWWNHKQWGSLEPYISLKSWLFGGNCLIAKHIETGHIFKANGSPLNLAHKIKQDSLIYNKMLVSLLLLPDPLRYINFLGSNPIVERAKIMIQNDIEAIEVKRKEYQSKIVLSLDDFAKKFEIDLRKEPVKELVNA